MAFDKLNISNTTTASLSVAISDDAKDTAVKVSEALAALVSLTDLESGERLDPDDLINLMDYFSSPRTLVLSDGDCVAIQEYMDDLVYVSRDAAGHTVRQTLVDKYGYLSTDVISDISTNYDWTINEVVESLSTQLQSSTVIARLSGLCNNTTISVSDVNAVFSDVASQLTPDMQSLKSNIMDLGVNLNPTSMLSILQQSYVSIRDASTEGNTIEFADNDFTVKSFCGTVVKDLITSAASVLGTILVAAGGIIGKLAGVALIATGVVSNMISTAANAMVSTKATYNPNASQYEFAQRLFKGSTNASYLATALIANIDLYGVILVRFPAFNAYLWRDGKDPTVINYEVYANMLISDLPTLTNGVTTNYMYWNAGQGSVDGFSYKYDIRFSIDAELPSGSTNSGRFNLLQATDYFTAPNSDVYSSFLTTPSDEEMRRRVMISILFANWQLLNLRRYGAGDASQYVSFGRSLIRGNNTEPYDESDVSNVLANYLLFEKVPSWSAIVNVLIPSLQEHVDSIPNESVGIGLFGNSKTLGNYSCDGSVSSCPSFRDSYLITPPEYTPQAIIGAVILTIGAVTAVTSAFFVTKAIVKKKITRLLTKKYGNVLDKYNAWMNSPIEGKEAALTSYLKEVKKYNKLAKITGNATITAVNGWIDSGQPNFTSNDQALSSMVLTLQRLITG